MRIKTALRKRDAAVRRLRDLYSSAEHFGLPSATINDRFHAIVESIGKHPAWVRAYLDGWRAALGEQAYRNDLVFGGFVDDKFYSTHHDREDYYEKHGISARDYADDGRVAKRGHYWKRNLRPYFVG